MADFLPVNGIRLGGELFYRYPPVDYPSAINTPTSWDASNPCWGASRSTKPTIPPFLRVYWDEGSGLYSSAINIRRLALMVEYPHNSKGQTCNWSRIVLWLKLVSGTSSSRVIMGMGSWGLELLTTVIINARWVSVPLLKPVG